MKSPPADRCVRTGKNTLCRRARMSPCRTWSRLPRGGGGRLPVVATRYWSGSNPKCRSVSRRQRASASATEMTLSVLFDRSIGPTSKTFRCGGAGEWRTGRVSRATVAVFEACVCPSRRSCVTSPAMSCLNCEKRMGRLAFGARRRPAMGFVIRNPAIERCF